MSFWFWHGLRNGIQSTRYPWAPEKATGVTPGRPLATGSRPRQKLRELRPTVPSERSRRMGRARYWISAHAYGANAAASALRIHSGGTQVTSGPGRLPPRLHTNRYRGRFPDPSMLWSSMRAIAAPV